MPLRWHDGGDPNDPGCDFRLDYTQGFSATFLHVPDVPYLFFEVDILTADGRVLVEERGQRLRIDHQVPDATYPGMSTLSQGQAIETDWRDWPTKAIRDLIASMSGTTSPACTLDDGLAVAAICHALRHNCGTIPYVL